MMGEAQLSTQLQIILLSLVPGLPMLLAFGMLHNRLGRLLLPMAPWTALPALATALLLRPVIDLEVPWFFMGGRLGLDLLGQRFLLATALVWLISGSFAGSYLKNDPRRQLFFFFYLLTMSGNFGLILARDMLGFYLFFGLMSFAAYGLIVHHQTLEALRAGRIYIILVMIGEVLLFSAMLFLANSAGSQQLGDIASFKPDNLTFILLFLGFGVKAGALPLHFWLPLAHPAAPVPASAVLSGAMIKAGLLGWLRFLPTQGDAGCPPWWGELFLVSGILAAFYGVIIGLGQKNPKTVLAYSSISQMGLMTIMVGSGLLLPDQWPLVLGAIAFFVLHHGLAKASLFLGVGVAKRAGGHGGPSLWIMAGLLLPALALAGMPFTSGAIAKLGLKEVISPLPAFWAESLSWLLPLASAGTFSLLCHFLLLIRRQRPGRQPETIPVGIRAPWILLLLALAAMFWNPQAGPAGTGQVVSPKTLWQGAWPVGLGLLLTLSLWHLGRRTNLFSLPAGDILVLFSRLGKSLKRQWAALTPTSTPPALRLLDGRQWLRQKQAFINGGRKFENIIKRWSVAGFCYLSLWLALYFFLAGN